MHQLYKNQKIYDRLKCFIEPETLNCIFFRDTLWWSIVFLKWIFLIVFNIHYFMFSS